MIHLLYHIHSITACFDISNSMTKSNNTGNNLVLKWRFQKAWMTTVNNFLKIYGKLRSNFKGQLSGWIDWLFLPCALSSYWDAFKRNLDNMRSPIYLSTFIAHYFQSCVILRPSLKLRFLKCCWHHGRHCFCHLNDRYKQ